MIVKLFCVHDAKVEAYLTPFFMRSRGEALRAWSSLVNDGKSAMSQHPADFGLFELGDFDDEKGVVRMYDTKVSLGMALEFKQKPESGLPLLQAIEERKDQ